jgi:hypothetical protein
MAHLYKLTPRALKLRTITGIFGERSFKDLSQKELAILYDKYPIWRETHIQRTEKPAPAPKKAAAKTEEK